ncbi:MAG: 30S ribosomal protein S8e [Halobacteriaceae archaeon]
MRHQGRSRRTKTGARVVPNRKKRKAQLGRDPTETTVGERRLQTVDARGNDEKVRALSTDVANVALPDGETERATLQDVLENPANPNYARRNIVTRGAIVQTDVGQARVTSRPGQDGRVDAVLLPEDEQVDVEA